MSNNEPDSPSPPSLHELEFWAAVLSGGPEPLVNDEDLRDALAAARQCLAQKCSPRHSCLAYYIHGKVVLLQRRHFPEWQRWVVSSAVLAREGADSSLDQALIQLCASLLEEYVRCVNNH